MRASIDGLIEFPLPKGAEAYGAIDGRKMHKYVVELARISKRYRDNGHPQFWGRIIGTSSDTETNEWLAGKFRALGLSDVRIQPLDLPPQWIPQSWDVTMTGGGKTDEAEFGATRLLRQRPAQGRRGAGCGLCRSRHGSGFRGQGCSRQGGVHLRHAGLGDRAASSARTKRARRSCSKCRCCRATCIIMAYPSGTKAPEFVLGNDDGTAARQMIEAAKTGPPPR